MIVTSETFKIRKTPEGKIKQGYIQFPKDVTNQIQEETNFTVILLDPKEKIDEEKINNLILDLKEIDEMESKVEELKKQYFGGTECQNSVEP
jgi:hypothetical protein